jgi:hypothetical protein
VANASSAATTVTMSAPTSVTANFVAIPVLSGLLGSKSGPANARIWNLAVANTGPGAATSPQINSLTLSQTFGAACTPVIGTPLPLTLANIATGGSSSGSVTIDFSGCTTASRFTVAFTFSANGGAVSGSKTLFNQFQ